MNINNAEMKGPMSAIGKGETNTGCSDQEQLCELDLESEQDLEKGMEENFQMWK